MNLVQLSNELEYLPKDKLAQMAQDPNSMYPPYLVLAEIQRRTQKCMQQHNQDPKLQ